MAKLSVEQSLMKASSHARKDEVTEAQKLYQAVLMVFPKNIRAQQGLAALNKPKQNNVTQSPPQEVVDQLVNLYNQGQLSAAVEQAQALTEEYPEAFIVWNILGASAVQIGMLEQAIDAYNKCISLKPDYAEAYINMGVALKNQGKLEEAIDAYNKCISLKPDYAVAYNNMGNVLKDQGKLDEAIEAYNKSISLKPDYADSYINMGNVLKDQGKLEEAIDAYNKALFIKPNHAQAYSYMGVALQDQGKLDKAIEAYNKCIALKPDYADAYSNMGVALQNQGKLDEAIEAYNKSISLKPDYADAYSNLGVALKDQGKMEEAIESFNKSISLKPDYAEAYSNMGVALQEQDKLDEAITAYNKAISLKPDYAKAYSNIGNVLKDQGKLDEAVEAYNKSISLNPDFAKAYSNMGIVLKDQGKLDESIIAHKKALLLKPDYAEIHHNLSFALLISGRLKEGLDENEWRWKTKEFLSQERHFSQPLWDGKKSLNGKKILLWCEQGIGDTLNWSSCLSLVTSQAKHCILECQEKLVPLLERSFPNVEVKPENRSLDKERDDFDFHLPMGSLYKHFIHEITQNNKPEAYLVPDPVRVNFWRKRLNSLGKGPYIGISWKSSVVSAFRLQHYPPISEWSQILTIPDVTFINLQYKDFADDLAKVKDEFGVTVHNFEDLDQYNNIDDVAALCAALDIVVSTKVTPPFISSGVGTSTKIANWKQSSYNSVLTNPVTSSFEMFDRNTWETWDNVFRLIAEDIVKLTKNFSS